MPRLISIHGNVLPILMALEINILKKLWRLWIEESFQWWGWGGCQGRSWGRGQAKENLQKALWGLGTSVMMHQSNRCSVVPHDALTFQLWQGKAWITRATLESWQETMNPMLWSVPNLLLKWQIGLTKLVLEVPRTDCPQPLWLMRPVTMSQHRTNSHGWPICCGCVQKEIR